MNSSSKKKKVRPSNHGDGGSQGFGSKLKHFLEKQKSKNMGRNILRAKKMTGDASPPVVLPRFRIYRKMNDLDQLKDFFNVK